MSDIQTYAKAARWALALARQHPDPHEAGIYRAHAREYIARGKQYRNMKRQADMFRELFDFAAGRH